MTSNLAPRVPNLPAHAACLWAVFFAVVHLYWLVGGRLGLPSGLSFSADDNLPLFIIDVVAIPLCLVAAALALTLARSRVRHASRRTVLVAGWGTTLLLVVHALPTFGDWVMLATGALSLDELGSLERFVVVLYEPFFLAGGVLFCLATAAFQLRTARPPAESSSGSSGAVSPV